MIHLAFEDPKKWLNFLNCDDINSSGIRRFNSSPLAMKMIRLFVAEKIQTKSNIPYIIPASVNHSPSDWAKDEGCLRYLHYDQLQDVKNGKAMVMLDQSLEGYQVTWLWDYLHQDCQRVGVSPSALIYVTGNMLAETQYNEWVNQHEINDRVNVISYPLFENDVYEISKEMNLSSDYQTVYNYKKQNINNIKDYSCLQKRLRNHRIWFYNYLYKENLLDHGLVSMNACPEENCYLDGRWLSIKDISAANKTLPRLVYGKNNNEFDDNYYIRRITNNVFNDAWVSVISEALFSDQENSIFLSEKIFKPIACMHPFIILGSKDSLKQLRLLGYKTFDGIINESYDDLTSFERFEFIIAEIKRIIEIKDKLSWYDSMRDVLEHNYKTFVKNSTDNHILFDKVELAYKNYFKNEQI
jgi:hypothetical protein